MLGTWVPQQPQVNRFCICPLLAPDICVNWLLPKLQCLAVCPLLLGSWDYMVFLEELGTKVAP